MDDHTNSKTDNKHTPYRMPEDFNPHHAIDAIRALAWAINRFVNEGPGAGMKLKRGEHASLGVMTELLQEFAYDFHDYFTDIENHTILKTCGGLRFANPPYVLR